MASYINGYIIKIVNVKASNIGVIVLLYKLKTSVKVTLKSSNRKL